LLATDSLCVCDVLLVVVPQAAEPTADSQGSTPASNTATSTTCPTSTPAAIIELTDGWHFINAQLDEVLTEHLAMGKIFVGLKLRIFGAQLVGLTQPTPPLELPPTAALQLYANGTSPLFVTCVYFAPIS
jgi:hypothetical protein